MHVSAAGYGPVQVETEEEEKVGINGRRKVRSKYNRRRRWHTFLTYAGEDVAPPSSIHNTDICTGLGCNCNKLWE